MNLYGMVMPPNPARDLIISAAFAVSNIQDEILIEVPEGGLGRVRDAWLPEGEGTVCILHRNYGDADVYTPEVAKTKNYVAYHSCADETYAWWEFKIPDIGQMHVALSMVVERFPWVTRHPMDRYMEIVANMGKKDKQDDPDVQRAAMAGEQIVAGIADAMETGEVREATNPTGGVVIVPGQVMKEDEDG